MKKAYVQPDLEQKKLLSAQTVSASAGDNDVDVEDAWGDF